MDVSKSTPDDLVVAFRSLDRRRREAIDAAEGAPAPGPLGELDRHIAAAAILLGTKSGASAVADAIAARSTDEWDETVLDTLRAHATGAGTALRRVVDAALRSGET
jgi:hypothetical protein